MPLEPAPAPQVRRLLRVTRHASHVTRHASHVTHHTSHVTRHTPGIIICDSGHHRIKLLHADDKTVSNVAGAAAAAVAAAAAAAAAANHNNVPSATTLTHLTGSGRRGYKDGPAATAGRV